jgi:hypothetical protein
MTLDASSISVMTADPLLAHDWCLLNPVVPPQQEPPYRQLLAHPSRALGPIRTGGLVVRNHARYPLRHEGKVGGERFELPQPKPLVYSQLVSPMNSPP